MTRRSGKVLFIEQEASRACELCGAQEECRPYGPRGEQVCFDCGMKDEPAAKRAFGRRIDPRKTS